MAANACVSVPIRGLFNLTQLEADMQALLKKNAGFRPHQGII